MRAAHPLLEIQERVAQARRAGHTPVLVFDLDHTLFDNGPRTWAILEAYAAHAGRAGLAQRLGSVPHLGLPYRLDAVLALAGETNPEVLAEAFAYWRERFFTDAWIHHDVPLPGAAAYCQALVSMGVTVVYLSGRDSPNMLVGTADSLRTHGFPIGLAHTVLVLKPAFEIPDLEFKANVADFMESLGTVIALFDNEPANCNLFLERFPAALSVLLETTHAPDPPPLHPEVRRLTDFTLPE